MAKVLPVVLGALGVGALLLFAGQKTAKAGPAGPVTPPLPDPATPPPPPAPPVVTHWSQYTHVRDLGVYLGDVIQASKWYAFSTPPDVNPGTAEQRDNVEALLAFQSRVGLTPDAQLGSRTAGALLYFDPTLDSTFLTMGVNLNPANVAAGKAAAQAAENAEPKST